MNMEARWLVEALIDCAYRCCEANAAFTVRANASGISSHGSDSGQHTRQEVHDDDDDDAVLKPKAKVREATKQRYGLFLNAWII